MRATLPSTSSRSSCSVASRRVPRRPARCLGLRRQLAASAAPSARRRLGGSTAGEVACELAACRRRDRCDELDGEAAQPLEARALLGGVLGREQRRARACRAARSGGRGTRRARASRARRRRCGAARRSAGSVRAPRAAPAATRSRRSGPSTRSSLRRRATWITRARSTWRSSIGGRASARTTAAASCGSTSRRSHASTSRTSARLEGTRPPSCSASASLCGGAGAVLETGTDQGYARSAMARAPLATLWGWSDRLARGPADRRADRRLAAVRRRAGRQRSSRWRTTSPTA